MAIYNGSQQRVQTIGYAAGTALTAAYTLDGQRGLPLVVDNGQTQTLLLYGQYAIGEYNGDWQYYLGDKELSVRQLIDGNGDLFLTRTYAPFGLLLQQTGEGNALFGYAAGQSGSAGLWFFGAGYYDPNTGQFLSVNKDALNRFAASALANPAGLLMAPVLILHWRRKKKGGKLPPAGLFVLALLFTVGLAACEGAETGGNSSAPVTPPAEGTPLPPGNQSSGATSGQSGEAATVSAVSCREAETPPATGTTQANPTLEPPPPPPTDEPKKTIVILFSGRGNDMYVEGPEPSAQTAVWWQKAGDGITDESRNAHSYKFPGNPDGKNVQVNNAMAKYETHYKDANLRIIGYSAGADSALLFAHRYYQRQKGTNGGTGEILSIALLGPTMTDNVEGPEYQKFRGLIGTNNNWTTIMNNLLLEGTDIYLLNDNALAEPFTDDKPENGGIIYRSDYDTGEHKTYIPPVASNTTGRLFYDVRPDYFDNVKLEF